MKVVSLIASATEILCALGFEKALVGRSHECDYPPAVKRLPVLTEPGFPVEGSSREIDRRVKEVLRHGVSVYRVFEEALRDLKPDLIVTQTHCEVCAVSLKDVEAALAKGLGFCPAVAALKPDSLADVWGDIRKVARSLGAPARGEKLVSRLKARMGRIAAKAKALAPRPRVAYIEWMDPLMAGGNWMPELISLASGRNLFGKAGRHSPAMSWSELKTANPDVLLIGPCGFDLARTRQELPTLTRRRGWSRLGAAREGRVYLLDGNQYFNRPGPRLAESLEILAEILHPAAFRFGHEGRGWEAAGPSGRRPGRQQGPRTLRQAR